MLPRCDPLSIHKRGKNFQTARITRDAFQHLSIYFTIPVAFGETRKGVGYGEEAPTKRCERKSSKELSKVS